MILSKKIIEIYKNKTFVRFDNDGLTFYYSYQDFDKLKQDRYTFKSKNGHKLQGYLYHYDNYDDNLLIIFDHGFGGGHRAYMKEIEMLCKNNFLVFAYDHTGCMESGGENTNGMVQSLSDLDDCITSITESDQFKNHKIYVMGHSLGGYATLNINAIHKNVSKIVVMSGFTSINALIDSYFKKVMKCYRKPILELEAKTNPKFVNYDALNNLLSSNTKALLIYSSDDPMCIKKLNYDVAYEKFKNSPNIEFVLEKNKGHNPNYTVEAVKYLNEYLKDKQALLKKKSLTENDKNNFLKKYDWNKMTLQDETVWNKIINFLKK